MDERVAQGHTAAPAYAQVAHQLRRLMGPTKGPRAHCSDLPLPTDLVLRDADLARWWGNDVMSMHIKAHVILHT